MTVRFWPISEVAARVIEVRSVGDSGLDLLTSSSSHFDPKATSHPPLVKQGGIVYSPNATGTSIFEVDEWSDHNVLSC
jgi:hypothetical protein